MRREKVWETVLVGQNSLYTSLLFRSLPALGLVALPTDKKSIVVLFQRPASYNNALFPDSF